MCGWRWICDSLYVLQLSSMAYTPSSTPVNSVIAHSYLHGPHWITSSPGRDTIFKLDQKIVMAAEHVLGVDVRENNRNLKVRSMGLSQVMRILENIYIPCLKLHLRHLNSWAEYQELWQMLLLLEFFDKSVGCRRRPTMITGPSNMWGAAKPVPFSIIECPTEART